eukprot:7568533-Alexandrium_andersonii.AAC.1
MVRGAASPCSSCSSLGALGAAWGRFFTRREPEARLRARGLRQGALGFQAWAGSRGRWCSPGRLPRVRPGSGPAA